MAVLSDYVFGTITVTNGSVDFTGTGTAWKTIGEVEEGDFVFNIPGATEFIGVIATVTDEDAGTFTLPWEGPDLTDVPYRLRYQSDGSRATAQGAMARQLLLGGNVLAFGALVGSSNLFPMFDGPGSLTLVPRSSLVSGAFYNVMVADLAARAAYDGFPGPTDDAPGYAVLVADNGDGRSAIYSKASDTPGDWSDPGYVTGPIATIEAGTTVTLPSGSPATFEVVPVPDGYALNVGIPEGPEGPASTVPGPKGDGLQIDATGPTADRALYDSEPEGFSFVDTTLSLLYFRETSTPGVWSSPGIEFGKGEKGDPGNDGALITTTDGVGDGTAGPYALDAAPIDDNSVWASISGVMQYNYTLAGSTITFGLVVPVGVPWRVQTSGSLPVGTSVPANDSIGASKLNGSDAAAIRTKLGVNAAPTAAVTDLHVPIYDGTTGKTKDSGMTIADLVPAGYAALMMTVSLVTLQVADNTNVALFGPDWVADSFDALTYVDVAGATALDSSVAGLLKPTMASTTQTISTQSGSADVSPGYTWFNRATALTAGDVITHIGVYSTAATNITLKIGKQNSTTSFDVVVSQIITHPGGGWADLALTSSYTVPGTGTYNVGASASGVRDLTAATIARSYKAGDVTGTGQTGFTADNGSTLPLRVVKNPTTSNMTVRSASFTTLAAPSKIKAIIRVKEVDAAVAGIDYTLECSRDGGTTWATMTLTELYTSPSPTAGIQVVQAAETSVAGQPTGTSPRWRFKTLNNKMIELHDCKMDWSV